MENSIDHLNLFNRSLVEFRSTYTEKGLSHEIIELERQRDENRRTYAFSLSKIEARHESIQGKMHIQVDRAAKAIQNSAHEVTRHLNAFLTENRVSSICYQKKS